MWLVLPFFGRALTSTLLQNNVGLVSAFLANVSLGGLVYTILNTNQRNGGLTGTPVGANLIQFLTSRGITGPFASVYGYWMIMATLIGKIIWISILIGISPMISAFIYWMFKSMGWSVYYLHQAYECLPIIIKNYFTFINLEMMSLYQSWFSPVVETTKTWSKYLLVWKICLNLFSWISGTTFWINIADHHIQPLVEWITSFQYVYQVWIWGNQVSYFIAGLFVSVMPTFITDFIIWTFSVDFLQRNWIGRIWGWIGRFCGWW